MHSDAVHFNSEPAGYMCGVWVALEDIDLDNGPVEYYPGSHKLPEITIEDVDRAGYVTHSYIERFRAAVQDIRHVHRPGRQYSAERLLIVRNLHRGNDPATGIEPQYATLRKGQAVWAANLLHGGSPQRDKRRTRLQPGDALLLREFQDDTPRRATGIKSPA